MASNKSNEDKFNDTDWPAQIHVSDLPYALSGYNTEFTRSDKLVNGYPEYVLKHYTMYLLFPITGARIYKARKQWRMEYFDDRITFMRTLAHKRGSNQETPFGEWSSGGIVSRL